MPVVSVILVFHRDTPYLRPTISSILEQTFRDFELLLVDNGVGLAPEALGEPLCGDPRIRWIRLPTNVGITGGHNAAMGAATGEFIAFMDSDDLSMPHRFERELEAFRRMPEVQAVSGLAERIDGQSRKLGLIEFHVAEREQQRAYALFAGVVATPATMVRRSLAKTIPYLEEFALCSDFDFQARLTEATWIYIVPEVVLQYRWYSEQTTQSRLPEIYKGRCAIQLVTARRRAGQPERLEEAAQLTRQATPSSAWRHSIRLCLAEGHYVLGAYHARKLLATERSLKSASEAIGCIARLLVSAPAKDRALALSVFFRGPVKALGIVSNGGGRP